ncbi:hypothetical protein Glove_535g19 [Diversispora epigaea]|uniref:GHMP kinase N-terminal domain-containing protein n=1 Tax=Diversispora epigaea TaxID=1348612 RepID=A0A397GEW1_9GLOM|nr:hypothetical protein Glove_535g19 [Diversispora epigaea]
MFDLLILATSWQSKLELDIKEKFDDSEILSLHGVPKPLLPISGKPALNWVIEELKDKITGDIFIITNAHNYPKYLRWANSILGSKFHIINNGETNCDDNKNFMSDIVLVKQIKSLNNITIIIQAELLIDPINDNYFINLLFDDIKNNKFIFCNHLMSSETLLLMNLPNMKHNINFNISNLLACVFLPNSLSLIEQYLLSIKDSTLKYDENNNLFMNFLQFMINHNHDAKLINLLNISFLFRWLNPSLNLSDYLSTFHKSLNLKQNYSLNLFSHQTIPIITRSYARIGLMGNPSDGFYGKTISFLISNFFTDVTLIPNKFINNTQSYQEYSKITIHPTFTSITTSFSSLQYLSLISSSEGYSNANSLIQATCKIFYEYCHHNNIFLHDQGFNILIETNIPRQVGLAGSSAIITALWKGLMKFYTINNEVISLKIQAKLIHNVEKVELRINSGLQDRVVQSFGGLMYMDFEKELTEKNGGIGKYERIDENLLPKGFWIAYEVNPSDSGKIHSDVTKKYENGDQKIIEAMNKLASLAEKTKNILLNLSLSSSLKSKQIATMMNENFNLRKEIFGKKVIGNNNLRMIELANKYGFAAKFTGSGGTIVGLWNGNGQDNESNESELVDENKNLEELKKVLFKEGFVFCWVKVCNEKYE